MANNTPVITTVKCSHPGCNTFLKEKLVAKAAASGIKPMCYDHDVKRKGLQGRKQFHS